MKIAIRVILGVLILVALLFGCAGRWDLPFVWAYAVVLVGAMVVAVATMDRDLMRERAKPGPGGVDRGLRFTVLPFFATHLVVASLDVGRFQWSGALPVGVRVACLIALAASMTGSIWAVRVNRFFLPVVRIQSERDHRLITGGLYRWVRHPGYTAAVGSLCFGGPALGSWWSMLVLAPVFILLLRRTIVEDAYLHEHLDGYRDYAKRVRYKLVPGVW